MTSTTHSSLPDDPSVVKAGSPEPASGWRSRLSGKIMILTIVIVMAAEVFIYVPSIANFRVAWLEERLAAAQIAVLALEEAPEGMVSQELTDELLRNAGVYSVELKSESSGDALYLSTDMPPEPTRRQDLANLMFPTAIYRAFGTLFQGKGQYLEVSGNARFRPDSTVEIVIDETPLCAAMIDYSRNILLLSIVIALLTAVLVYYLLMRMTVRPIERITRSMEQFRLHPYDSRYVIEASDRADEVGRTERELFDMQRELQAALQERARLAELGTAVSKINHDLKNILTSAQLVSDQLARIDDPKVQRLGPKLFQAIDRAVDLCTDTLKYGKAEEAPPHITRIALRTLVSDIETLLGLLDHPSITFINDVSEEGRVEADHDQLYRILMNLVRNALQVLTVSPVEGRKNEIRVAVQEIDGYCAIDVSDNGPGIPEKVREGLFKPFSATSTPGGSGLGLAIARELSEAQGGTLDVLSSGDAGTTFRICLPHDTGVLKGHVEP